MNLTVKCKSIQNFQEKKGEKSKVRHRVLRTDIKSMIHKMKINKLDFIEIKIFCSMKDPVKKMKRQVQTGRKYL